MIFDELLTLVSSGNAPHLCVDSRLVKAGDIFVAIEGTVYDGHDFIDKAVANGAEYILCQHPCNCKDAEVIIVPDSSRSLGLLAQAGRGNPASQLTNLAVTGTNGKTTVAYLVRSCIRKAGEKCGLISTIIYDTGSDSFEATLTTPDCLAIARRQSEMLKAGSKYMVIEASSHALSQNRLAGINFKAAAFTNLAGDHLDYHKTKANYLSAKTKLFEALSPDATAVLNKQSPDAKQIASKTVAQILWYAVDAPADIEAHIESMDINGTVFTLEYHESRATSYESRVKTSLLGRYNVSNHLAAAGLCLAAGYDLETIAAALSAFKTIPGRLEKINCPSHERRATGHIFIDYAHTDDALKNVLATLKPLCKGRLIVVFGCGGDRDRTKRPRMARVADQLADFVIVTSDNPRTEQPECIIGEIITGFEDPVSETITFELDRKKAIELAIETAGKDDIVLIAGKGHETYQVVGQEKFEFSDKKVAQQYLKG